MQRYPPQVYSRSSARRLTCSTQDIVERFQVFIFIFAVIGHNCSDLEWDVSMKWLSSMGYMLLAVYLRYQITCIHSYVVTTNLSHRRSECLVDWIKHCFVCKFNTLQYLLYNKFRSILAADFVAGGVRVGLVR